MAERLKLAIAVMALLAAEVSSSSAAAQNPALPSLDNQLLASPTSYKSQVNFEFPKGILETANAPKVKDSVGQVLKVAP